MTDPCPRKPQAMSRRPTSSRLLLCGFALRSRFARAIIGAGLSLELPAELPRRAAHPAVKTLRAAALLRVRPLRSLAFGLALRFALSSSPERPRKDAFHESDSVAGFFFTKARLPAKTLRLAFLSYDTGQWPGGLASGASASS